MKSTFGGREQEGQQQDPAADRGVEDRLPDALAAPLAAPWVSSDRCARGVVAGDRVLGQQEAERQHVEPEGPRALAEAGVVDLSVKTNAGSGGVRAKISTRTTIAAPNTCHHTEMLLIIREQV